MRYLLGPFKFKSVPGPSIWSVSKTPKNAKVHLLKRKCQVAIQLPWELSTAPGRLDLGEREGGGGSSSPKRWDGYGAPGVSYRLLLVPRKKTDQVTKLANSKNHHISLAMLQDHKKKKLGIPGLPLGRDHILVCRLVALWWLVDWRRHKKHIETHVFRHRRVSRSQANADGTPAKYNGKATTILQPRGRKDPSNHRPDLLKDGETWSAWWS